ncbi:MAG: sce7726 family protein [Lachnospiraceae bacterium]|nr:sce7726 family protein [Lachnospiraceae bacterium]
MEKRMHDRDMREPLFDYLEEQYGKIRILEEKTIGKSRADVVMVTPESLYGIEIKSDADTYVRLQGQVRDYDRYYDYNIVAVGTSHAGHIEEHVPAHWGIITAEIVDGEFDFYMLRKPKQNPKRTLARKLEFLWRPELAQLQQLNSMPKYKDKRKDFVIDKVVSLVPEKVAEETIHRQISEILFERDYTTVEETLREYRKGELQKAIEAEEDPGRKMELMMLQAEKKAAFPQKRRRRRSRRK